KPSVFSHEAGFLKVLISNRFVKVKPNFVSKVILFQKARWSIANNRKELVVNFFDLKDSYYHVFKDC
ncbi:10337_t:CDS:1, partial [Racocetra persica]